MESRVSFLSWLNLFPSYHLAQETAFRSRAMDADAKERDPGSLKKQTPLTLRSEKKNCIP